MKLDEVLKLFSDKETFKGEKAKRLPSGQIQKDFEMLTLSKDGIWHYSFRVKETKFNRGATVDFSKWHPLHAKVLCFDICDEEFLLHIIEECKQGIL